MKLLRTFSARRHSETTQQNRAKLRHLVGLLPVFFQAPIGISKILDFYLTSGLRCTVGPFLQFLDELSATRRPTLLGASHLCLHGRKIWPLTRSHACLLVQQVFGPCITNLRIDSKRVNFLSPRRWKSRNHRYVFVFN